MDGKLQPPPQQVQARAGPRWRRARGLTGSPVLVLTSLLLLANGVVVFRTGLGVTLVAILVWILLAIANLMILALLFVPRQMSLHRHRSRIYDHVKRRTRVEQFLAGEARERQRTVDLAQLDLDPLLTGGGGETGLGGVVKPAALTFRWVRIHEVPSAWWVGRQELMQSAYTVRWTPLIDYPTPEFFQGLADDLAHALGIEAQDVLWGTDGIDLWRKRITFRVAQPGQATDFGGLYQQYGPAHEEDR